RRGLRAIWANHIQGTRGVGRRPYHIVKHGLREDLELLHDGYAGGKLRLRGLQVHVAHHPDIFLRVQSKGADTDAGPEALRLAGVVHRKPDYRVRRGVGNPDTILGVDDDVERRLQPRGFDDLAILDSPAWEIQQLVVRAVGDPDVAIRGNADAHQAEEFLFERKITFAGDRLAIEIHHENFPVEAGDPDPVFGHGRAPADAVNAHASEAGDRRRENGAVRSN